MQTNRPSDAETVDRTLRLMRQPLAGFVREMTAKAVEDGGLVEEAIDGAVREIGYGKRITELDTRILLKFMGRVWNPVFWDKPGKPGRAYATELHFFSNAQAHQHDAKTFDARRFVDTAMRLLVECGIDVPDELQALHRDCCGSEPPFEAEVGIETKGGGAMGVEDLIRERTTILEERLAHLSTAVTHGNDTLVALLKRSGRKTDEPGRSETRQEECTDRQAAMIFRRLLDLGVDTADDDAVGDALDDQRFDGSHIKTWCQRRYTKGEAASKIRVLNRKVSNQPELTEAGPRVHGSTRPR